MVAYWLVFTILAYYAMMEREYTYNINSNRLKNLPVAYFFLYLCVVIFIGLRFEVGGDWHAYMFYLERVATTRDFTDILQYKDPGYQVVNFIASQTNTGIRGVNIICAAIFSMGLFIFCTHQPRPFLSLLCSFPYLIIVIAMGYTRQSVAIGLSMIAFYSLLNKSMLRFSLWILLAALFHKSAVLMIPIAYMLSSNNKILKLLWLSLIIIFSYFALIQDSLDTVYDVYIEAEYQSQGALIRILMCVIPALLFLKYKKSFNISSSEVNLWNIFSYLSIACLLALFLTSASTIVDRIALYLLPLQLVVFSHLPKVLGLKSESKWWVLFIVLYFFLVQLIWLFFAKTSEHWLPYNFYIA